MTATLKIQRTRFAFEAKTHRLESAANMSDNSALIQDRDSREMFIGDGLHSQ